MRWMVMALLTIVGGYMIFDGVRALTVGDYLKPASGKYQGELGPWSSVVENLGIAPRSTGMKIAFVVVGTLHLAAAVATHIAQGSAVGWFVLGVAISGLWYLPFGTIADIVVIGMVVFTSVGQWR